MKKISNPLTIIGMFAVIAEVAGTTVLPFVSEQLQPTFIWYVMGFPVLLVVVFFITLNFNSNVLYGPDDFKEEKNFMKIALKNVDVNLEKIKESNPNLLEDIEEVQSKLDDAVSFADPKLKHRESYVLELITNSKAGLTSSEISEITGLSLPAINRILSILINNGLVIYINTTQSVGNTTREVKKYVIKI